MKKLYIVIGVVVLILLILVVISTRLIQKTVSKASYQIYPTAVVPTYVPNVSPTKQLYTTSTSPADKTTGVNIKPQIALTFNRMIAENEIAFSIAPDVPFTQEVIGNKLIIRPISELLAGTTYTYIVKYPQIGESSTTYTFTTIGPTQEFLPDTRPSGFIENENKNAIEQNPDVYVANLLPLDTERFSADSEFSSLPTGHFKIIVTIKGDETAGKQSFIAWLQSQHLNQNQIAKLDIVYK